MPTPANPPTTRATAAALVADDDHRGRIRAATWLLSRQPRWLSAAEFVDRVLHLNWVAGSLATAWVEWSAAADWMESEAFGYASPGEQSLYRLTVSLAGECSSPPLGDLLVDLDGDAIRDALAAMAWAGGHREIADELGVTR